MDKFNNQIILIRCQNNNAENESNTNEMKENVNPVSEDSKEGFEIKFSVPSHLHGAIIGRIDS